MNRRSILFFLWAAQGLAAFFWLLILPGTSEKGFLLGFSLSRLALMATALGLGGGSIALFFFQKKKDFIIPSGWQNAIQRLAIILSIASLVFIICLRALGATTSYSYTAYAERLAPLAFWVGVSALELAVYLAIENRTNPWRQTQDRKSLVTTLWALTGLGLVVIFISVTRLGITPYNDGSWGVPTTPLLEWQIITALGLSLTYLSLARRWTWLQKDRFVCLGVYLFTSLLWLSQPINPGYFATPPRAPNFEIYPFSDGLIYAQYAQSALVGNGFMWPDVPTRPLYITFLTWLHAIAGQNYTHVIIAQTLVLAAFPAVLYLLGKEIYGRPLGLGLALLATLRDLTANVAAPFANNYTYTKLYFSEIPAALLIGLFALLMLRWMKQAKPAWYLVAAGGVLGLGALVRLQSAILLLATLPVGYLVIREKKRFFTGAVLLGLGFSLTVSPWLVRNYFATGGIVLDNPISQSMVLARRWSGDNGNTLLPQLPGEKTAQYSSRMTGIALANLRTDPGRILGSAVNHFFNNEISNLLIFPLRDQLDSPKDLVWPARAFWQSWSGQPGTGQWLLIAFYLLILGIGLAAAFQANHILGLLPLAFSLVYNAWTALFLSSGDRFLVPVDWAVYLYLFLGLLTLCSWVLNFSLQPEQEKTKAPDKKATSSFDWQKLALAAALVLFCGSSLPLTELAFPRQYPAPSQAAGNNQTVSVTGRAIYPRWYKAGEGEPGSAKLGYGKSDQARLVFFLVGQGNMLVILPIDKQPKFFPNTSEVTVSGIITDGVLNAQKISVNKDGKYAQYTQ